MREGSQANGTGDGETVHRECPACGDDSDTTEAAVRAPVSPESLEPEERAAYWRGFRSKSCFFDYVRCPNCGLLYCSTYFSDSALDRLYASMPDNTAGAPADVLRHTQKGYIDFLVRQRPIRGTYLEIGPDIGLATEAACASGNLDRVVLVEPNLAVHKQLREAAGSVTADVVADLGELESPTNADTVVLIHVLDHLTEPVSYLLDLRRHLAPGAHVLVVVHNEASMLRRLLGVRWPPFTLQHPQLFNPETLRMTLEAGGFTLVAHQPTTNVFPARHVVRTAGSLVGLDGKWIESIPNWRMRIRLGNMMAVAKS
jgi:hypothetical protein